MRAVKAQSIFRVKSDNSFLKKALEVFRFQSEGNPVYKEFIEKLRIDRSDVRTLEAIPFLPVEFFKTRKVITGSRSPEKIFESSGTTGSTISRHYVTDTGIYDRSLLATFNIFYGDPAEYMIAAMLPSYLERENSSLIYMVEQLIRLSRDSRSGFFGNNPRDLLSVIASGKADGKKILLIGVSYALLDLAENFSPDLSGVIVMETGGMKGRRKEITREELHSALKKGFNVEKIHSEYGMTELLSQAYSSGEGIFRCPPWMKIIIRDPQDPFAMISGPGRTGGINIIDLANINSCCFIETSDLGSVFSDGSFEISGRFDDSEIRGCNLMISE